MASAASTCHQHHVSECESILEACEDAQEAQQLIAAGTRNVQVMKRSYEASSPLKAAEVFHLPTPANNAAAPSKQREGHENGDDTVRANLQQYQEMGESVMVVVGRKC